jgi:NADPH:quinone reductase-like Zn-dependent oxidoreductase
MKAVVYEKYGGPEVLKLMDFDQPIPTKDEVLVKVMAVSVNSWDWDRLTGKPRIYRLISGISKPKLKILGADIAGIVESVGDNVTKLKIGDEVFGDLCEGHWGGFAQYACARESELFVKSPAMSFEEAAAFPQAGVMALQAIRDEKKLEAGNKILMNGAGGGVGSFIIQMARMNNLHVTAVDSADKLDFMQSLGADEVIDFRKEDFTRNGQQYDLIIDVVANRTLSNYSKSLRPGGVLSVVGGRVSTILKVALFGSIYKKKDGRILKILVHKPNKDLNYFNELFETGRVKPVIDKVFPLNQTSEALQYIGNAKVKGKAIVRPFETQPTGYLQITEKKG